jgi:hypothetical protein
MGTGTKEFKEEAPGLYQGSSMTAGGLGERQDCPFSSWRGAEVGGNSSFPNLIVLCAASSFLLPSLPPVQRNRNLALLILKKGVAATPGQLQRSLLPCLG